MKKVMIALILLFPILSYSQDIGNYLILHDIGDYKYRPKRTSELYGNSGSLISASHFDIDHDDTTYKTRYVHPVTILGADVQVTQHAGADSDKWLLHEVESGFRKSKELGATYVAPNPIRDISGSKIFYTWGYYRWISNSVVVSIQFTDYTGTKPEPLEIVQAYLQKFPSTITLTDAEAKDRAHSEQWIKDEMDRRLWLCDRWFAEYQLGKVDQGKVLNEAVDHMNVFLDYRQKYYGISAKDEKIALDNYLQQKDEPSIKSKLTEYKTWWSANKTGTINLP